MPLLSWEQSSFFHSLGSCLLPQNSRVGLNNQNVLFNTFLTIEWYLCDKFTKSDHNFKFSYQSFLKTLFTTHGIFMSQEISVQCTSYHLSCFKLFFFPEQPHDLSSPRLIGSDIVTKKLNSDIQKVTYTFVLNDCCISYEGFNY